MMTDEMPKTYPGLADFDAPGALTVVLQGGLSEGNAAETANHCRHWRHMFPEAEIILSLSGTSILDGWLHEGVLRDPKVRRKLAHDSSLQAALSIIRDNCDQIVMRADATSLPPIKSDSAKLNNVNLQIAAAQNGLAHATGRYVLRVRSDLIFLDRGFLDQYSVGAALPRGDAEALSSRVLISWLYTLNPYTIERLPLHLSDWFHFGLLQDVRKLWDIPYVELKDAVHYMVNPFADHSNLSERIFNIRLADEQFIAFNALRKLRPELKLDYHNDHSGLTRCMDVFLDNFTLCDLVAAKCIFGKYSFEFDRHDKTLHCITPALWRKMVDNRQIDYRDTLAEVIAEATEPTMFEQAQAMPRVYPAVRLGTKSGRHLNSLIVADRDGVLSFGPHVILPRGRYVAHVDATVIDGEGSVTLSATVQHGAVTLATRTIALARGLPTEPFELAFEITSAFARDFEVVCTTKGVRQVVLNRIVIDHRDKALPATEREHVFAAAILSRENAVIEQDVLINAARSGLLARSPRFRLPAGAYVATIEAERISGRGEVIVQVMSGWSRVAAAEQVFAITTVQASMDVTFVVDEQEGQDVEIICGMRELDTIAVRKMSVKPDPDVHQSWRQGSRKLADFMRRVQR